MARKTYTTEVEAYIDAELAAATEARARAAPSSGELVSATVSFSLLNVIRAMFVRQVRLARGTVVLAFLPILVIVARAGLGALSQVGVESDGWLPWAVQGITVAAVVWAGLVTLWQARNAWRRALGRAPATLWFRRTQYQDMPPLEDIAVKLGVAVAALAAVLWLALSGGEPLWLLLVLVALPPIFFFAATAAIGAISGLGARGGVDDTVLESVPVSSIAFAQMDDRIAQLQQIRIWLKDDKLKAMIDDVIGKQVAKSERRQVTYSVAIGALSLLAGWLLSAISPVSALAQLLTR